MKNKTKVQNDNLNRFFEGLGNILSFLFDVIWYGLKRIKYMGSGFWILSVTGFFCVLIISKGKDFINFSINLHYEFFNVIVRFILGLETENCIVLLLCVYLFVILFLLGIKTHLKKKKYQDKLDDIGLSNAKGVRAKVIKVLEVDEYQEVIVINGRGIGLDRYKAKKNDLESAFSETISEIRETNNKKFIEIVTNSKVLPKRVPLSELAENIKKPYSFLAGESLKGPVCVSLKELPHLLIAGTTGGGKSVCFRQILLTMLKNSNLQLYLLDLKKGVEVKEFEPLSNVQIAKDETESVNLLQAINEEMQRRFVHLEKTGHKIIDPKRDRMDLIIVGVDEASELYGVSKGSKKIKEMIFKARELTDKIAKLGRAAGIHLILATQKVIKETIDTKVQENIGGRICFRMNTGPGSQTVLGNNMAHKLPDIKGRAIWANGNKFTQVQVPFVSEEEIKEELAILESKINSDEEWNFQKMIEVKKEPRKTDEEESFKLTKNSAKDEGNTI